MTEKDPSIWSSFLCIYVNDTSDLSSVLYKDYAEYYVKFLFLYCLLFTQKRLAKEAREQEMLAKSVALGKKVKESAAKVGKGRGEATFFRVICKVLHV